METNLLGGAADLLMLVLAKMLQLQYHQHCLWLRAQSAHSYYYSPEKVGLMKWAEPVTLPALRGWGGWGSGCG